MEKQKHIGQIISFTKQMNIIILYIVISTVIKRKGVGEKTKKSIFKK